MNLAIKGLLAIFWLILIPACAGIPFLRKKTHFTPGECFLTGYLFLFAAAEVLTLPMILLKAPLHILVWCYGAVGAIMALAGIFCLKRKYSMQTKDCQSSAAFSAQTENRHSFAAFSAQTKNRIRSASPFFWCALILIAVQIIIVVLYAHFDADDAFYVATATTSVDKDSIFIFNPYTGKKYRNLPSRYVLSPFPIFLAVVSELCAGLHPAIMAHTIFPPVFQVMSYLVVYRIGSEWFKDSAHGRGIFLYVAAALNSFFAYSTYNSGSFQMIRIWQGKALLAAALIPLLFYLSMTIVMEEKPKYPWYLLFFANIACCLLSSMGIILAPILQGSFALLGAIRFRSLKRFFYGILCCTPSVVLGIIYILII